MAGRKMTSLYYRVFLQPLLEKKRVLAVFLFSLALLAISQSLVLLLLGPFLKTMFSLGHGDGLISGSMLVPPRIQEFLPKLSQVQFQKHTLIFMVPGLLVLAGILKNLAGYLYQWTSAFFALHIAKRFRDDVFAAILNQNYRDISLKSAAEWMSILMNDVLYLQNKFSDIANGLVRDLIMFFAAFFTLFFIHWPTALGFLIIAPLIVWGLGRTGKKIAGFTEAVQIKLGKIADLVLDFRKRFEFIKAHRGEAYENRRFEVFNTEYYKTIRKSIFVRSIFAPVLEFLSYAAFALILIYLGNGRASAHFSASDMIVFLAAVGTMMRPLRQIGEQLTQFHETQGAIGNSLLLLSKLKAEKTDLVSKAPIAFPNPLSIRNLQFEYSPTVSVKLGPLSLPFGKAIAIIGPSGGGKSTFLKTLAGLLSANEWDADVSQSDFAKQVSFVSQTPFLFDDTVLGNLNYGLEKTLSGKDMEESFRIVGIEEEILKFRDGLNTNIKALTSNISGGQRQRLVLVRALLRKKPFLLLDEATSSVDPVMEENMIDALLQWARKRSVTVLSVTHRLAMLSKYDEIWYMENGSLTAVGSFDEFIRDERFKTFSDAAL